MNLRARLSRLETDAPPADDLPRIVAQERPGAPLRFALDGEPVRMDPAAFAARWPHARLFGGGPPPGWVPAEGEVGVIVWPHPDTAL